MATLYSPQRKILLAFAVCLGAMGCALLGLACGGSAKTTASGTTQPQARPIEPVQLPQPWYVGQVYHQTAPFQAFIYTGKDWVPYQHVSAPSAAANTPSPAPAQLADTPCTSYACNPGGAHSKHASFACVTCHKVKGNLVGYFDPNGPAIIQPTSDTPNPPAPSFDAVAKTCSNVACHGQPSGSFNYYFPGGDGEPVLNTFTILAAYPTTPNWYTSGMNCTACHGNPPVNGGVWHSGQHAMTLAGGNDCQLCHSDATGSGGLGTAITNTALHRNGAVDVQAQFSSKCFGCH